MKNLKLPFVFLALLSGFNVFSQVPTITSFSPTSGPPGTAVVITGTNFSTTAANNIVYFGAVKATVSTATATSCTVSVPDGTTHERISLSVGIRTGYSTLPFITTQLCPEPLNTGSFSSATVALTGTDENPYYSVPGDFDNDGKPDFALAETGANQITCYRNTTSGGSVSFSYDEVEPVQTTPRGLAAGDLNGDGKLDLVAYNSVESSVSVLSNTTTAVGSINFGNAVHYDVTTVGTTGNGGVAIGDLDGDGKPEIVSANGTGDSVTILRNLNTTVGAGFTAASFASPVKYRINTKPCWVHIGDFDGDGKPDLVTSNESSDNIAVLRNQSTSGTISFAAPVYFTTGNSPDNFAIGDIDGDGRLDVAMVNYLSNSFSVLRNTSTSGTVSFASRVNFTTPTGPRDLEINDLNGDGAVDVAVLTTTTDGISVFDNTCTPGSISFAARVDFPLSSGSDPRQISIADLTQDEKPDMLTMSQVDDEVVVFKNLTYGQPYITNATTKTICSGSSVSLALTNSAGSMPTVTYNWIATSNTSISGESTTTQTGSTITNTLTNTTAVTQTVTYTVSANANFCTGGASQPQVVTITVNPKPAITAMTSTVCTGTTFTATPVDVTNGIVPAGTTYSWSAPTVTGSMTGGASGSNASSITGTLTNTTTATQTATYVVTPTTNGCSGSAFTLTVSIRPKPTINSSLTETRCSGIQGDLVISSNIPATYSWYTTNNPNTTGESTTPQTGVFVNDYVTNISTGAATLLYTIIPTSTTGSCVGNAATATITINPQAAITPMTSTVCSSASSSFTITPVHGTNGVVPVGTTYSWPAPAVTGGMTNSNPGSGAPNIQNGLLNPTTTAQTATYTVTPLTGFCTGPDFTLTVTVNPAATINNMPASACTGTGFTLTPVNGTNGVVPPGTTYSWAAPGVTGGMTGGAGGSGASSLAGVLTNTTSASQTGTYTITPVTGSCTGSNFASVITVNPRAVITAISKTVCTATAFTVAPVNVTNGIVPSGTTYTWPLPSVTGGMTGGASGSNAASLTATLTNTTSVAQTATYTVTPQSGSCTGSTFTVTVTVNPKAAITAMTNAVCSGTAFASTPVNGTNGVVPSGTTYTWSMPGVTGSMTGGASGSGAGSITGTLTNTTTAAQTATYTITPLSGSCGGSNFTLTVMINPRPVMTSATTKTICSGSSVNLALTSGTSATYQWQASDNLNTSGESTSIQTGSTITNTVTSSSTSIQTVTYTVTPTSTAGSCVGTPQTVSVTLDNVPPVASAGSDSLFCPFNMNLYGNNPSPGTGAWTVPMQSTPTFTVTVYNPSSYNSLFGFNGIVAGDNATLRWTITSQLGVCPATFDEVVFTKGTCPLTAAFTTSANNLCIKPGNTTTVTYTDQSVPGSFPITSYAWTFTGGTPSSATGPGPHVVTYNYSAVQTSYSALLNITASNGGNAGTSQLITVNPLPSAAGTISGTSPVCQGQSGVSYSIPSITNANSYSWVFPTGATSMNPNNIAVTDFNTSAQSGVIKVTGVNTCGAGDTSYFPVTVNPLPLAAGTITGPATVCQGQNSVSYSVPSIGNATSCSWTFPTGGSSSSTATTALADFSTTAQPGLVTVAGVNACGSGIGSTFSVTVNPLPAAIGTISGPSPVCQGQPAVSYSVSPVANAASYSWSLPSGAGTISTGNVASIDFSNNAISGLILVTGVNACGNGVSNTFSVSVNPLPAAAGTISGITTVCQGQNNVSYSVPGIANATGYSWTFPTGGTSVNPNNTAVTDFDITAQSGMITVAGMNACGAGTTSTYSVTVNPLPGAAGTISGTSPVCQGQNGLVFSVPVISDATSYSWTFPSGLSSSGTSDAIGVDFSAAAQSGIISVTGVNSCGTGTSSIFSVSVDPLPAAIGVISGPSAVCEGQSGVFYSVDADANASAYVWSFPTGASNASTTNVASADFAMAAQSGIITVYGTNTCGNGVSNTFSVAVNSLPIAAGSISGPDTVCAGTSAVSYSVPGIINATAYNWTFPPGAVSVNPNNIAATDFDALAQSGLITVQGVNACGVGAASAFSVTVDPLPDAVMSISGPDSVCQGEDNIMYAIAAVANASSYTWSSPPGSSGTSSTTNLSLDFSAVAQSGTISVYAQNACGNGAPATFSVALNPLPGVPLFSGSTAIPTCPLPDSLLFTFAPAANATSYNWLLPAGAYNNGVGDNDSIYIGFSSFDPADTIRVASFNGCGSSAYSYMTINALALTVPEICRVTVDTASNYNEIYWDKSAFASSDTFLIYRDTSNNAYGLIGKVPYDSLSMFIDTVRTLYAANGDPNASSWRYKIAVEDSCGQISAMSPYHQTIFIQHTLGNFSWNDYQIEGQPVPVPDLLNYYFNRDDFSSGTYNTIQVLSASSTAYTDVNYATYAATGRWRTETSWNSTCYFTFRLPGGNNQVAGAINTSRSNVKSPTAIGIAEHKEELEVAIYPVPAIESLTVEIAERLVETTITLENMLGQVVYTAAAKEAKNLIDCRKLDAGVYLITVSSARGKTIRKIVIQ
jgi:hypothetical protein